MVVRSEWRIFTKGDSQLFVCVDVDWRMSEGSAWRSSTETTEPIYSLPSKHHRSDQRSYFCAWLKIVTLTEYLSEAITRKACFISQKIGAV